MLKTYWVEEYQALVHHLERAGHFLIVFSELDENLLGAFVRQLNQEGFGRFHVVCGDEEIGVV